MERVEMMNILYSEKNEDSRLTRSRHGQLEYLTTMSYIHKLVPSESKILEVGAAIPFDMKSVQVCDTQKMNIICDYEALKEWWENEK